MLYWLLYLHGRLVHHAASTSCCVEYFVSPGLLPGVLAILAFGMTLPFTRLAVLDSSAASVFIVRLLIASALALVVLLILRVSIPARRYWLPIGIVSAGVVFGFPLFTSLAMDSEAASHGGVVLGILPLATAVGGALINGEKPGWLFWLVAAIGSALVVVYSLVTGGGSFSLGDLWLILAIASAAIGYALGGRLSGQMPAWQVISWALAPALPVGVLMLLASSESLSLVGRLFSSERAGESGMLFLSLMYLGLISQYGGFLLWYRALVLDGIARASQLQLLQPFFTLAGATWLLGEHIDSLSVLFASLIILTVFLSRKLSGTA